MSHGHLRRQFLQFQLLKLDKLGTSSLQLQRVLTSTTLLTRRRRACFGGHEFSLIRRGLVDFGPTVVARIRGNHGLWLDIASTDNHALQRNETPHVMAANLPQRHGCGFFQFELGSHVLVIKRWQCPTTTQGQNTNFVAAKQNGRKLLCCAVGRAGARIVVVLFVVVFIGGKLLIVCGGCLCFLSCRFLCFLLRQSMLVQELHTIWRCRMVFFVGSGARHGLQHGIHHLGKDFLVP
mmetsp:Transcript_921/g.2619  ORF Transcript_921/g.2619 Transcript_921/m.2619 type:complete len:236 (-) Transcript_921:296-1003(-)